MKTFNTYENTMMQSDVYIKLNESSYLFVGSYEVGLDLDMEFHPASMDQAAFNRINIRPSDKGSFEKRQEWDGLEINIDPKYNKAIIKKTLEG